MLRGRTVFLISPEEWDFVFVSKHHYAMELAARGNKVYFINPPQKGVPEKLSIKPAAGIPNLFIVDYSPKFRGLRFLPSFLIRWADRRFLKNLERKAGVRFDVIWNFENSRFFDLRFAGKDVLKLYFQVDEDQNFHPAIAAKTADIALAINSEILNIIRPHNQNSFVIPHSFQGCLSEKAQKVLTGDYIYKKPEGALNILYVGNLEHGHININLFEKIIRENNNVVFHLVGPYNPDRPLYQRLKDYKHVHFKGKVPYKEIPSLLDEADALILVYDKTFTQSSHKILEYLASGKVIISTYMSEHAQSPSLVSMCQSHEEYPRHFRQVLSEIEKNNSPEKMKLRIRFALDNTYSRQLDKLEELIHKIKTYK